MSFPSKILVTVVTVRRPGPYLGTYPYPLGHFSNAPRFSCCAMSVDTDAAVAAALLLAAATPGAAPPPLVRDPSEALAPELPVRPSGLAAAFDTAAVLRQLRGGHGAQRAPDDEPWLVLHVSDPRGNDARSVLLFYDSMRASRVLFVVSRATMSGLARRRPGLVGLNAVVACADDVRLPRDADRNRYLHDRTIVVVVDADPAGPAPDLSGLMTPCARGCGMVYYSAPQDVTDRGPFSAACWTLHSVRPQDGACVAVQFPAVGAMPPPPQREAGRDRRCQPPRAAKRKHQQTQDAAAELDNAPLTQEAVREFNHDALLDCDFKRVVPLCPSDTDMNWMDFTKFGPQTVVYAPGPALKKASPRDRQRAVDLIEKTSGQPFFIWHDERSNNPGNARKYFDTECKNRITRANPLTPGIDRYSLGRGHVELHVSVGSKHFSTVKSCTYPGGKRGLCLYAHCDIPRGTIIASYGGLPVPVNRMNKRQRRYALDAPRRVVTPTAAAPMPVGEALYVQGNEVGTTMHFMDHRDRPNVGIVGADEKGECYAVFASLFVKRKHKIEISYGSEEGQGDAIIESNA